MDKATRSQTRHHNSRLVLKTIYDAGEISRAEIARRTHLTRPTVSTLANGLLESGLVIETGPGPRPAASVLPCYRSTKMAPAC